MASRWLDTGGGRRVTLNGSIPEDNANANIIGSIDFESISVVLLRSLGILVQRTLGFTISTDFPHCPLAFTVPFDAVFALNAASCILRIFLRILLQLLQLARQLLEILVCTTTLSLGTRSGYLPPSRFVSGFRSIRPNCILHGVTANLKYASSIA